VYKPKFAGDELHFR